MWFGAQRALLLQLAHPAVAAAVDAHSEFRRHPHQRLSATADGMILLVWGNDTEVDEALGRIDHIHDRVHGELPDEAPPWHRGDPYTAHDRRAQAWVWATLVETSRAVYERYVRPLSDDEADQLLTDWRRFGISFGIGEALLPRDRAAFADLWQTRVSELRVTPTARRVAASVFEPPMRLAPRRLKALGAAFAVVPLLPSLAAGYGYRPTPAQLRDFVRTDAWLRAHYRALPEWRRMTPDAYVLVRRIVRPLIDSVVSEALNRAGRRRRPHPGA